MDRVSKVVLRGDVKGLQASLTAAGRSVQNLVGNMSAAERQSVRTQTSFRQFAKVAVTSTAALGIAKVIKDSVTLEAAYSKTMAQVAVATNAPKSQLKDLDELALKLGKDTVFSAQDAAQAMLELAKGGLSTAQIKAGALADTLTLASAGGLDLGTAAGTVVNAMGAFQIKADKTSTAVAALAGAANASSSDVSDITQALAQAGTSAHSAGLSIQDTTAYLALFSNQGIKGSDAGTSLRTMLTRLVPQTNQAKQAMDRLHLSYVDGNGQLVNATEIASRTQKAFKGLSDEERIRDTNAIFGQDAQRAVNAITAEGADGLRRYMKATNDQTQAQKLAKAANSGTAGSIENLKGSIETAEIKIGKGLAPTIQKLATEVGNFTQTGDLERWASEGGDAFLDFLNQVTPLAQSLGGLAQTALPAVQSAGKATVSVLELAADVITPLVDGFNKLPDAAQQALILAAGAHTLSSRIGILPGLSDPAGASLLGFGGKAEKAGKNAEKAGSRFSGLAGSLKAYAALAGVAFAVDKVPEALHNQFGGNLKDKSGTAASLAKTIGREGQTTPQTLTGLKATLKDSDLGKNAEKFGISLDRLAKDMLKSGDQGTYLNTVLDKLGKKSRENGPLDAIKGPFSDPSAAVRAKKALEDAVDIWDKAGKSADRSGRAFNETRNELMLAGAGINKYRDVLRELPTAAVTQITAPGALDTKEQIIALARQYNLTPKQVETLMKVSDADFSKKQIQSVLTYLDKADGKKSTSKMTVTDLAGPKITNVRQLMNDLDGNVARTEIINTIKTIKKSYTDKGVASPSLKDMLTPYTGMRLPEGYATGGRVPGTPPADPTVDNVWARGANTGKMLRVRSGEWILNEQASKKNDKWLAAMNYHGLILDDLLPGFASGGRYDTYQSLQASTALDIAHQRQEILNLEKSLREKETVGKGKSKHKRLSLRGYDRHVAQLELAKAKADLAKMRSDNIALKAYGTPEQEAALDEVSSARTEAAKTFSDNFSIGTLSSTSAVDHQLTQMIANASTFTSLLSDLKAKGASPWLLAQLVQAGPTPTAIRLARQYDTDSAALAAINSKAAAFDQVSNQYAGLVSDPRFSAPTAWSSGIAAPAPVTASLVGAEVSVGQDGLLHFVKGQIVMAQDSTLMDIRNSN